LIFGPVPSRRLGRSLGINNIPPKSCSYSCVYCQVGSTANTEIVPRVFYEPDRIHQQVAERLEQFEGQGTRVDYLTFVPDGEPTLDSRLKETIERLRPLGIPIAIISNASLIWREEIRETLMLANWVSLKVDAIEATLWRRVNRPHPSLDHEAILNGMLVFAREFDGTLTTESMLIKALNDTDRAAYELAGFLEKLDPSIAYLSTPTRPPAEKSVHAPHEVTLNRVFQIINQRVDRLELINEYEGNVFSSTVDVKTELLSITSVHPMREDAVQALLAKTGTDWHLVERLIDTRQIMRTEYEGRVFYIRCIR
jgi:wyosine [tRNA(Phe)-imidazoG37] synthetase (radical SAM superfamily)